MMGGHQFRAKFGDPATVVPADLERRALAALAQVCGPRARTPFSYVSVPGDPCQERLTAQPDVGAEARE